ncbi:MAG: BlaI/MecI/CopY family transcriptional regulator [Rikenellaceae bacterium]|nr:BlaI/MecI/CopY family transcriptional regulator [Rikenellaceae bacterium]
MQEYERELTKAELQVMQILWDIEHGFVSDILSRMDSPKPAYNTVSTIVRILERKGFVSHHSFGKSHRYYPLITKSDYTDKYMKSVLSNFFGDSVPQMVSFFSRRERLSLGEIDQIIRILEEGKKRN